MKKTLIALALTALPVASMADVVLYGKIQGGVETSFAHKEKGKKVDGTTTQIVDYGSRIGFKGHEQLNDNLKAIWQVEQNVTIGGNSSKVGKTGYGLATRDSFIGLEGAFGTVKAGYLSTPVKDVNGNLDQWSYDSEVAGLGQFTRGTDAVRRATAVSYTTPDVGGFKATAYVSPSDNNHYDGPHGNYDNALYGLGASYNNSGFFADVAGVYVKNGKYNLPPSKSTKAYQALAQAGYANDQFSVGAAYQRAQNVDKEYDVVNEAALSGSYNVDSALKLKATAAYGWGINDTGNGNKKSWGNGKYYQGIVGAEYALSKRTVANAQVGYLQKGKNKTKDSAPGSGSDAIVGVGLVHKF
ncbi:porin [Kingella negevensis]|uniref:porin n=1 Tax=Kingella negevensis TaxID=1522312 RepID=UPI0025437A0E|nr:porin [Kingella negevensis]WII93569.1 porin [Kingella negevensis]